MKVYLAGPFGEIETIREWEIKLIRAGHESTSSWLTCDPNDPWGSGVDGAKQDLDDIDEADAMIQLVCPNKPVLRGSRHVEFGYAIYRGKTLIIVGTGPENIFHQLPEVTCVPAIEAAIEALDADAS